MIKSFKELIEAAQKYGPKTIAVAVSEDEYVLKAVDYAYKCGLINAILVGNKAATLSIAKDINMDINKFKIVDIKDKTEACKKAVELVRTKNASLLMKGLVDTSILMKAVLNKETGLMSGNLLSHVGVLKVEGYDKFFILSDTAVNIMPTLKEKVKIINNAVKIAHSLGNVMPKVAVVCAVEKPTDKMPSTLDAVELTKMNDAGDIKGCMVGGPFALDNAISLEAAQHKGIQHPVAGNADILILPNIETGNVLIKAMEHFAKAEKAGIVVGAAAPIILTSRASSDESKFNSIALAVLTSN
ncbi:MAG: phosphate butyryltransferase [Clostridiaceae bacterium]|nr:phosphate butyryltransferase [Clostridiaceae bacterium]